MTTMINALIESSAMNEVSYDPNTKNLRIYFNSNPSKGYDYPNVPEDKVIGLLTAESAGRYYHKHIKQYAL